MNKTVAFLIMFIIPLSLFSQGFYFRAGSGYGLPVATSVVGENYLHRYDGSNPDFPNSYSSETVSASFGAGNTFNIGIGYKFNANLWFDLNVQYLAGRKFKTSSVYLYNDGTSITGKEEDIIHTNSHGFFFNPAVVFSAGFGKGAPYGRFGFIAASPKIKSEESYYYDLDGVDEELITWEYGKGLSLGYQAAVGMNWKISDNLDFYTEVNFVSMTYYPSEGEMTEYISNGDDILSLISVRDKNLQFKKSYDPQAPFNPDIPRVVPRQAYPFSSVSVQAGVRFTLWQKQE